MPDGPPRAAAVEYVSDAGGVHVAAAAREVVLCAGAIESPHLLQLSGVGPPELLRSLGIAVVAPLDGVGGNLQDHLEFYHQYECRAPVSLRPHLATWRKALIGARWLLTRDGLGATNHFEAGGFVRSRAGVPWPDVQLHFLPVALSYDGETAAQSPTGHSFQLHVGYNRSPSRGAVRARAPTPRADAAPPPPPEVQFNYMSSEDDWAGFRAALRISREIVGQPAFDDLRGAEIAPGPAVQTDAQIDARRVHMHEAPSTRLRWGCHFALARALA